MKTTLTARVFPATRLLPVAALWTFLGRIRFINSFNCDSSEFGFVLNHPSKLAISPLVQPLVHLAAVVNPITDAANITDPDRRDIALKAHLHDLSAQFMKEVRDLVVDVVQLLVFRLDERLPAIRSSFLSVYLRIELGLQLVLVVAQSAKLAAVDRESVLTREDSSEVLLPEINSGNLVSGGSGDGFCVVLSTDDESIRCLPDLDGSWLFIDRPINQNRLLSAFCGEPEDTIISKRDALVGPPEYVVGLVTTLRRIAFSVIIMPRPNRFVELLCDFLGCLRGQFVVAFAVPPAHRRLTEPVVLSIYSSPVPLADVVPQIRGGAGEPLKLLGALNMEFASQVHTEKIKALAASGRWNWVQGDPAARNARASILTTPCLRSSTSAFKTIVCKRITPGRVPGENTRFELAFSLRRSHGPTGPHPPDKSRGFTAPSRILNTLISNISYSDNSTRICWIFGLTLGKSLWTVFQTISRLTAKYSWMSLSRIPAMSRHGMLGY